MQITTQIKQLADKTIAQKDQKFFKTGKGEYGEGDIFLGVRTPELRKIAKQNTKLKDSEIEKLLQNKYHEIRLTGFFILVYQFQKAKESRQKEIYELYMKNLDQANNWDIIDTTIPHIIGKYLITRDRSIIYKLADSKKLWHRRIAIMTTQAFIRQKDFNDTIKISEILLHDHHDLIHKATGWMLREIGKKEEKSLLQFLDKHAKEMPRTMLRYAIEKLTIEQRRYYRGKR